MKLFEEPLEVLPPGPPTEQDVFRLYLFCEQNYDGPRNRKKEKLLSQVTKSLYNHWLCLHEPDTLIKIQVVRERVRTLINDGNYLKNHVAKKDDEEWINNERAKYQNIMDLKRVPVEDEPPETPEVLAQLV